MQIKLTCPNGHETVLKARNQSELANRSFHCETCGAPLPKIQAQSDPRIAHIADRRRQRPL